MYYVLMIAIMELYISATIKFILYFLVLDACNTFEEHEYYFGTDRSDWNGAKLRCEAMSNSTLAFITTEAEQTFLIEEIKNHRFDTVLYKIHVNYRIL